MHVHNNYVLFYPQYDHIAEVLFSAFPDAPRRQQVSVDQVKLDEEGLHILIVSGNYYQKHHNYVKLFLFNSNWLCIVFFSLLYSHLLQFCSFIFFVAKWLLPWCIGVDLSILDCSRSRARAGWSDGNAHTQDTAGMI